MFKMTLLPRFYETDAFGHVNNTVITGWFETAREPIFKIFTPNMIISELPLILARVEVDYVAQTHYGKPIEIITAIERMGNASFIVTHAAYQDDTLVAKGKAVQVYFDFKLQKSLPIPAHYRAALEKLIPPLASTPAE